jgi:hypothetical protein
VSEAISPGKRLACPLCTTEVVAVRIPADQVTLACRGEVLVDNDAPRAGGGHPDSDGEGVLLGKRYADAESGLELLCTKAGPGALSCDGRALTILSAKPLPSSD